MFSKLTRSITFIILTAYCISIFAPSVFAQKRPAAAATASTAKAKAKCSGAWSGSITYTRTQSMSDSKTVERVSGRGQDKRDWQMSYNYRARVAVIESAEQNGSSMGKATISMNSISDEKIDAVEKNSCDRGKTWRDMRGTSRSQSKVTGSATVDANVNIGINSDGTYTVSVGLPQISGESSGSQESSFSGQCTPKEGRSSTLPPTPTTIDGNSLTSDGKDRVNDSDPNRLSGSYSQTWQNVTETITWNLQRCGAPLRITDVKFEDMKFPDWNAWQEIVEQKGTIDGNLVKIKATVLNASGETKYADVRFKETYKGDKWDGARPDAQLDDSVVSVRVEPGEEKEVEMVWDSSGYSWYDDGRPRLVQRIKAELEENGKKIDEMTKNLKVAPKPLVLVHGLWSNWKAWEIWQNILTTSHSYDWKAFPVGEKPEKGLMNTGGAFLSADKTNSIFENAQQVGKYIRYAQEDRNAWHVDIVAHSMGGLISRQYIHAFMPPTQDGRPQVSHLIMLGTPNLGSPCADVMDLAFRTAGKDVEAVRQLKPDVVAEFNRATTNRKGVKFSALAGEPLPVMCKTVTWNDGVVPVESAIWQVKDNARSKSLHTDLTDTANFSSFVKPRLAIGPKGDHNPSPPDAAVSVRRMSDLYPEMAGKRFYGRSENDPASVLALSDTSEPWGKAVRLGPKETLEIELPVEQAQDLGVTFMAFSDVGVELIDASGTVAATDPANGPGSRQWFRSLYIDKPVIAGRWKVVVTNSSTAEREAIITSWVTKK